MQNRSNTGVLEGAARRVDVMMALSAISLLPHRTHPPCDSSFLRHATSCRLTGTYANRRLYAPCARIFAGRHHQSTLSSAWSWRAWTLLPLLSRARRDLAISQSTLSLYPPSRSRKTRLHSHGFGYDGVDVFFETGVSLTALDAPKSSRAAA